MAQKKKEKLARNTITFIFRTGLEVKKSRGSEDLYLYSTHDTRGVRGIDTKSQIFELARFSRAMSGTPLFLLFKGTYQ